MLNVRNRNLSSRGSGAGEAGSKNCYSNGGADALGTSVRYEASPSVEGHTTDTTLACDSCSSRVEMISSALGAE